MRVLAITGTHPRHNLFVHHLQKHCDLYAHLRVQREELVPDPPKWIDDELAKLWRLHFQKREAAEMRWYGHPKLEAVEKQYTCHPMGLNNDHVRVWLKLVDPDIVFLAGCPIIKDPLFSALPEWKINMHMGLIPWFKGSITMFWPSYMLKPHWSGCSYHVIERLVDTGMLIHQTSVPIDSSWGLHDLASANYLKSCEDVGKVLRFAEQQVADSVRPNPDPTLATRGKTFTKKDWHPEMLRTIYEQWEDKIAGACAFGKLGKLDWPELVELGGEYE
jgi:methionyl-tRNA formyltransferase